MRSMVEGAADARSMPIIVDHRLSTRKFIPTAAPSTTLRGGPPPPLRGGGFATRHSSLILLRNAGEGNHAQHGGGGSRRALGVVSTESRALEPQMHTTGSPLHHPSGGPPPPLRGGGFVTRHPGHIRLRGAGEDMLA